ncbi:putative uncharacterized protein DDB_G0278921, partial [Hyalella azteca]|uniref:SOCS box domain-containing protein n=1 Tax=Hyalella azteca TaxID=294128 RepID=A0A8B7NEI2_HYAAZ
MLPAQPQSNFNLSRGAFNAPSPDGHPLTSNTEQTVTPGPMALTYLCKKSLISHFGMRKLRRLLSAADAPKCVTKFLSTVSAKEFIVRSSAPLLDVFEEPFFHRTVTWRVHCRLDGQTYLATYGHTETSDDELTGMTSSGDMDEAATWLWCDHPHVMRVWGVVVDEPTRNLFYLLDTPIATLDQVVKRLKLRSMSIPEPLIWSVLVSVTSALLHGARHGLRRAPLLLGNVFLLRRGIAVENGLTSKSPLAACSCNNNSNKNNNNNMTVSHQPSTTITTNNNDNKNNYYLDDCRFDSIAKNNENNSHEDTYNIDVSYDNNYNHSASYNIAFNNYNSTNNYNKININKKNNHNNYVNTNSNCSITENEHATTNNNSNKNIIVNNSNNNNSNNRTFQH